MMGVTCRSFSTIGVVTMTNPSPGRKQQRVPTRVEPRLMFREVTRERLDDFVALFESRGAPKACWCMVWPAAPAEIRKAKGPARKAAMTARIKKGVRVGILGYLDDEPVAWCSIAPRDTYRDLGGEDARPDEQVWSIVCFFIKREHRGQGLFNRLLLAAIRHARSAGATRIEAYPVDPDSPSYRFMGFVPSFEEAGFVEIGRAGGRRHVMRLTLKKSRTRPAKT